MPRSKNPDVGGRGGPEPEQGDAPPPCTNFTISSLPASRRGKRAEASSSRSSARSASLSAVRHRAPRVRLEPAPKRATERGGRLSANASAKVHDTTASARNLRAEEPLRTPAAPVSGVEPVLAPSAASRSSDPLARLFGLPHAGPGSPGDRLARQPPRPGGAAPTGRGMRSPPRGSPDPRSPAPPPRSKTARTGPVPGRASPGGGARRRAPSAAAPPRSGPSPGS